MIKVLVYVSICVGHVVNLLRHRANRAKEVLILFSCCIFLCIHVHGHVYICTHIYNTVEMPTCLFLFDELCACVRMLYRGLRSRNGTLTTRYPNNIIVLTTIG